MISNEHKEEEFGKKSENVEQKSKLGRLLDTRLVALFVLGVLIGITVKTQATKTITMGFDDYKLKNTKQEFDLSGAKVQESEDEEVDEAAPSEEENSEDVEILEGEDTSTDESAQ